MQYKIFKDGIKLSRLGMGVMRLPVKGDQSEIDYKKAKAVIDMAMEKGSIGVQGVQTRLKRNVRFESK